MSSFKPWQVSSYDGYVAGSIPNKAQYPDVIRQMYPWRIEAIRQWQEGKFPSGIHIIFGTPLLANFQSFAMYPLNSIFLFFRKFGLGRFSSRYNRCLHFYFPIFIFGQFV